MVIYCHTDTWGCRLTQDLIWTEVNGARVKTKESKRLIFLIPNAINVPLFQLPPPWTLSPSFCCFPLGLAASSPTYHLDSPLKPKVYFSHNDQSSPLQISRSSEIWWRVWHPSYDSLTFAPSCDSFHSYAGFLIIIKWLQQFQTFSFVFHIPWKNLLFIHESKCMGFYLPCAYSELTMVARGRPFVDWLRSVITEARDMQLY